MLSDLSATEFARQPAIGEFTGIDFAADARFRMFQFRECWVETELLFPISIGGQTCKDLFCTYSPRKYNGYYTPAFLDRLRSHVAVDYDNVFVLGGIGNYWHFLVDHLGKLPLLGCFAGGPLPVLVMRDPLPADYRPLVERACAFLRVGGAAIVTDPRPVLRLTNASVPCVNDLAPRLRFLRDFGRSLQTKEGPPGPERILLKRGTAAQRRVLNEAALEERLEREFGFVGVDSGAMTVLEQINAVRNARIIVGGHGAALTNLIFAADGAHLIELYAAQAQTFFKLACDRLRLAHHFVRGQVATDGTPRFAPRLDNLDYAVDADEVLRLVGSIVR